MTRDSQNIPPALAALPAIISGSAPMRATSCEATPGATRIMAAIGLIAGGLLTSYANWRWVFFVNVPIGLVLVLLAPRVLGESERVHGNLDLPGAITGSVGLGALVYGLSEAATTFTNGQAISHWGKRQGHRVAGSGRGIARGVRAH